MRISDFKKKIDLLPFVLILIIWIIFASPYLFLGKAAFPSTYQVNAFPPWSTYSEFAGPVKNNAQPDIITQIYPWRNFSIEELKKGRIAFWNPYSFAGTPHLANYQSAVLFPLNTIFFLPFKFITVWSLLVVLQPLLAGLGTYLFVRKLSVSSSGSLVSSISFMFCGFLVTWMGYATLGYAILPLPFALYAIEKYLEKQKNIWLILLSLTFPFSFFAGHFQTSIYFAIGVSAYTIFWMILTRKWGLYLKVISFIFFGILMTMPQVMPSIEFYLQSVRSAIFQKSEAIPWGYLPTLLAPDFYGNPVTRNDWFGHYAEWNGYTGSITFTLALFAIIFKRNLKNLFFIILLILSLFLAYDTPLLSLLIQLKIPVLSTSAASRIIVLFSFSVAVLAGFGMDSVIENIKKRKRSIIVWVVSVAVLLSVIGSIPFIKLLPENESLIAKNNMLLPLILIVTFLGAVLISYRFDNTKFRKLLIILVISLLSFEMLRFASKWQSFDNPELVFKNVPTTEFYEKEERVERFLGEFTAENAVYYRLLTLSGYDPLYPERYGEFVKFVGDGFIKPGERSVVNFPKKGLYTPQALDFLGVRYIAHKVSDGNLPWAFPFGDYPAGKFEKIHDDSHYQIFENKEAYPRAYIVNGIKYLDNNTEILNFMFENNLRKTAVVGKKIQIDKNSDGEARIIKYEPNKIKIETITNGKGFLVLTDNYYPGWEAKVNGKNQELIRTDYTFRGIEIPKGKSIVELNYLPESFLIGVYLFLIGWLGIISSVVYKSISLKK